MRLLGPGQSGKLNRVSHIAELFTDRKPESQSFKQALAKFRALLDDDVTVGVARHNMLVYFGKGGIGKTSLSHRFQSWINRELPLRNDGWGAPPPLRIGATAHIDLHDSSGNVDVVAAILSLRRAASKIESRWPLFDLAFAAYWSAARPSQPLPDLRNHRDLQDLVEETLSEVLSDAGIISTGISISMRTFKQVSAALKDRSVTRRGNKVFADFGERLEVYADQPSLTDPRLDLLCEIAEILAWEIANVDPIPLLIVFVDTAERLTLDPRRVAEGYLNRLVYGMPTVLFVVTGRNAIDWYDSRRIDLPFRGPSVWPGLLPDAWDEPKQHRVHNLSDSDSRLVLTRIRSAHGLQLSDETINKVVIASHGLPQYLEMVRQVAITVKESSPDQEVCAEDVTGSIGQLVKRVLEDVPADEQRALRAAALFRSFDVSLVSAASGEDHGCVERAVQRPIVDQFHDQMLPYRVHDEIRESIRLADSSLAGGWSEADWRAAATRAVAEARSRHDDAKAEGDVRAVLVAIGIAISVICEEDAHLDSSDRPTYADWLSQAIVFAPSVHGLEPHIPTMSATWYGRQVLDFIIGKSLTMDPATRESKLRAVFDADHPLSMPAGRHLIYQLRDLGQWDTAIAVWHELVAREPTPLNMRIGPIIMAMARRFRDAVAAEQKDDPESTIARSTQYFHGKPEKYFAEIGNTLERLRGLGRDREVLEESGTLLMRTAFFRKVTSIEVDNFRHRAETASHHIATRSALVASIFQDPLQVDADLIIERLGAMDVLKSGEIGFRTGFARLVRALAMDDEDQVSLLVSDIKRLKLRNRSWIPIECMLRHNGWPIDQPPTQWLEPRAEVDRRWGTHLQRYLDRRST